MKAILYQDESRGAALKNVPKPVLGPGEVLLAVDACGLCGSDILKLDAPETTGRILGHELAGRVAEIGAGVHGARVGDRVVVAHHVPCLRCHYCRRGHPSMCRQFKATNIDPGGFSEFVRVSEKHVQNTLLKIPDGLDALSASLTEPLACCLRNVKRLGVSEGDVVGVIGLGSIGLLTGQLLRHFKASVVGFDLDPARLKLAGELGFAVCPGSDARETIARLTDGRGLDALVFTAGKPSLVAERLGWIRDGGTVNIFAEFHVPEKSPDGKAPVAAASLDLNEIYHRELTVMSSYSPALEDLREALGLIASGAVSVKPFVEKTYPLADFSDAVRRAKSREILKAILLPQAA